MSNNYSQSSFLLPLDKQEQISFAKAVIECVEDEDIDFNEETKTEAEKAYDNAVFEIAKEIALSDSNYAPGGVSLGFVASFEEEGVHIYHDENIDIENAALFSHLILKHFNSENYATLAAAFTCDRPRLNEFGGAAAFITAKGINWMSTFSWVQSQIEQHARENGCPS